MLTDRTGITVTARHHNTSACGGLFLLPAGIPFCYSARCYCCVYTAISEPCGDWYGDRGRFGTYPFGAFILPLLRKRPRGVDADAGLVCGGGLRDTCSLLFLPLYRRTGGVTSILLLWADPAFCRCLDALSPTFCDAARFLAVVIPPRLPFFV
jgi:hypothetical protein